MCETERDPVPRIEKRADGYRGDRPGSAMGPPAKIPSGSVPVTKRGATPRKKAS